jgi:hypothetical protein
VVAGEQPRGYEVRSVRKDLSKTVQNFCDASLGELIIKSLK